MREWEKRPPEIKYLLNPAFCGRILYVAITEFENRTGNNMPFALAYLILPMVLHKETRDRIHPRSRKTLYNWVQSNQSILINLPTRARGLVDITSEALDFLLCSGIVLLNEKGEIGSTPKRKKVNEKRYANNEEIVDCIAKTKYIARWFADAGTVENVFVCLGVRP